MTIEYERIQRFVADRREDGSIMHVHQSEVQVRFFDVCEVVEVDVRPAEEDEEPTHWGWTYPDGRYSMIYPGEHQVRMCFPGPVEEMKGELTPMVVQVVR